MPVQLAGNRYGESEIRLVKITRQPDRHDLKDLTLSISLEGDFEAAHIRGDNRNVLPAEALKNTVYALAKADDAEHIEEFAIRLAEYFIDNHPQVEHVRVEMSERPWARVVVGGKPDPYTFSRATEENRTASVTATREAIQVEAGIRDLVVLKTAEALFGGYREDPFTAQRPAGERILTSAIRASWRYGGRDVAYGPCWHGVRQLMLDTFAQHKSESVQHMLYAMGEAVLESFDEIEEIRLSLPNTHCLLVNLQQFGLDNPNEILLPVDQPHGAIEAVLRKG